MACCYCICLKPLAQLELPDKESLADQLRAQAVEALREAIAAGWSDAGKTAGDSDLEPLCELPEFQELLGQMKAKVK